MNRLSASVALPNGRLPDAQPPAEGDAELLRARVQELETLCAEVYIAAVDLGLPQPLLNRLWTVAAHGNTPHTWAVDLPPRTPSPGIDLRSVQKIKLTDRPGRDGDAKARAALPDFKDIPSRRRVLVVDDDPMMMAVLVRILRRENFDLVTALSGPEALEKLDTDPEPIDLLITDYAMPAMKGRDLADGVRRRYPNLRVLYQTGFSDLLFENRSELEEHAAFLEKPFTARGLREAARLILFGAINPE